MSEDAVEDEETENPNTGPQAENPGQQAGAAFPHNQFQQSQRRKHNSRIGNAPGAGPVGSQQYSYDDLPSNPEALKQMYLEMQKNYRDTHALLQREKMDWEPDSEELEDYISKGWDRIAATAGVFSGILFILQLVGSLSLLAQIMGAITLSLLFDQYVRPVAEKHT